MAYTIILSDKEAADMMAAMARQPVDQIGETYVSVRSKLTTAGYNPAPPVVTPLKPPSPLPHLTGGPQAMAPPPATMAAAPKGKPQ